MIGLFYFEVGFMVCSFRMGFCRGCGLVVFVCVIVIWLSGVFIGGG